jgi:hypothetical protein
MEEEEEKEEEEEDAESPWLVTQNCNLSRIECMGLLLQPGFGTP